MTALALLAELRRRGVVLEASGDRLRYRAPSGALTAELRAALAAHKDALLEVLRETSPAPAESPRPPADAPLASAAHVEASAVAAARATVDRLHKAWERHVAGCRRCEPWRGVRCPDGQALAARYYEAWRRWQDLRLAAVGQEVAGGVGNRSAAA